MKTPQISQRIKDGNAVLSTLSSAVRAGVRWGDGVLSPSVALDCYGPTNGTKTLRIGPTANHCALSPYLVKKAAVTLCLQELFCFALGV